ncbi:aldehyde dehydrogenase domain-containing protein [Aspergillus cavernicola]|uniref:aldehyde dehydrogenase (NAD(+)) n=1 Tax=Aspergillus cavernicola TaxID=176166 RepID=A0ABR4HXM9_9EURO
MTPSDFAVFDNFQNTINGQQTSTTEKRHSINPASGQPNPDVPVSTPQDVDRAVEAAKEAFETWSEVPPSERKKAVLAFADGLEKHAQEFAKLLVQEQGKPLQFATLEITGAINWLRETCDLELKDEIIEDSDERKLVVRHTPIGVAVGIVPWNFPLTLCCLKLAPAVLTGNTVIIKPSPFTPYCGLKLVELAQQVFPPGVVQALSGDDNLGPWLTAHPGIDKISFTGSSATGKKVMESAAKTLKRVTLELGGNDAAIICKGVDVEAVAAKVASLGFMNSGQICVAIKRIYIHESIYDRFRDAAAAFTKTLKLGEGNEEGVFMGPIQNAMQYEKVKSFFSDITKDQLSLSNGGICTDNPGEAGGRGYFIRPTIIDKPAEDSRLVTEEPFGPILPLLSWNDEKDVIARANNTRMGLGASVWSNDLDEAARIASKLQAGTVWVNTHMETDARAPFGGHKESGIGAEMGLHGLRAYCNVQTLFLKK